MSDWIRTVANGLHYMTKHDDMGNILRQVGTDPPHFGMWQAWDAKLPWVTLASLGGRDQKIVGWVIV